MADVVVAKIQNRRGLRRDLPQPLAPGEIGFCTDTGEMFIGADPDVVNGFIAPVIESYMPGTATNQLINTIGENQIVQIQFTYPVEPDNPPPNPPYRPNEQEYTDIYNYAVTQVGANDLVLPLPENYDIATGKMYIAYESPIVSLPGIDFTGLQQQSTERFLIDTTKNPTNLFTEGKLALDTEITNPYTVSDANAIAIAINAVDNDTGLVTVSQNVQIWTRPTDVDVMSDDVVYPGVKIALTPTVSGNWNSIPQTAYNINSTDAFIMDYAVSSSSKELDPKGIAFDSTSFYITNSQKDIVDRYDSLGVYDPITFDLSGNIVNPAGIVYDDTNLWVVGNADGIIHEYTTAGNSTNESIITLNETVSPYGITWDSTNLWVVGNDSTPKFYKYTRNVENVPTGLNPFIVSGETSDPRGITWGNNFYWVVGSDNGLVYQYDSDGVYTTVNFDVSGETSDPRGITWDGTYFWVVGNDTGFVYRYDSSGVYTTVNFDVSNEDSDPTGITWDGTYFWVAGNNTNAVYRYDALGVYANVSVDVSAETTNPSGVAHDGAYLWVLGSTSGEVYRYDLGGAYTNKSFDTSSETTAPAGLVWDGKRFMVTGAEVYSYSTYTTESYDISEDNDPRGIAWDGTYFWVVGNQNNRVYQYNSSGVYTTVNFDVSNEDTDPCGITFDGTYLWVVGGRNERAYKYDTSGVYTNDSFNLASNANNVPNYTRTGTMRITATPYPGGPGAIAADTFTENTQQGNEIEITFRAVRDPMQPENVMLEYRADGIFGPSVTYYLTTNSRRWKSFT